MDALQKKSLIEVKTVIILLVSGFLLISAITVAFGPRLVENFYPLPEDQGAAWYYWQLDNLQIAGGIAVWGGYILHQLSVWAIFIAARRAEKRKYERYAGYKATDGAFENKGLIKGDRYTVLMMISSFFFVLLHLLQTHLWYGGLAQFVPIWTSQGSVIVMLVLILVMEMPRRGLFWGKWRSVPPGLHKFLRGFHGPFIAWAIVYTFWFHPMEGNWGLMSGFMYMFMLFSQMVLFRTKAHKNRSWVVLLESFVAIHGTLITVYKVNDAWTLFLFGFSVMIVLTYMHTWKINNRVKLVVLTAFLVIIALVYTQIRSVDHVFEVVFIPIALYGGAIGLWLIGKCGEWLSSKKVKDPV